jgi:predicted Fe-Mo cluster-binding NifX family protein
MRQGFRRRKVSFRAEPERYGEISMKIAIARDGSYVSQHFGHCEGYAIYYVKDGIIFRQEDLESPGHQPGVLPGFLAEHQVTHILAGGMGPRAVDLFHEQGIEVIIGVSGPVDRIAQDLIAGRIVPGESSCTHEEGHSCNHD